MIDCLCAGLIVADHVCDPIERMPRSGELVTTSGLKLTMGGSASNVAIDLTKLGASAGIAGRIGDDVLGQFVQSELQQAGVERSQLEISKTAQTSATLVVNVAGEDRRFIHTVGANAEFTGREIDPAALDGCRVLCIGGHGLNPALSGENITELFRTARAKGVTTVLDIVVADAQTAKTTIEPVLPFTDYFFPNNDEGALVTGLSNPIEQAAWFSERGAGTVIVTCGANGAVCQDDDGFYRVSAHSVRQVDGTGGGDAFVAGYVLGLLEEQSPQQRVAYGAAMGASCVQSAGSTTGVFHREQLHAFVQEHPLSIEPLA